MKEKSHVCIPASREGLKYSRICGEKDPGCQLLSNDRPILILRKVQDVRTACCHCCQVIGLF